MNAVSVLRRWWPDRDEQIWLSVRLGYWHELKRWPRPGSIFRWDGYLPRIWYCVKCAFWRRYDRLEIPTLPPTWNEWDTKLLHAAFAILADYMEGAKDDRWSVAALEAEIAKVPDDWADEHSRDWCVSALPIAREEEALYRWWTVERDQEQQGEHQHRGREVAHGRADGERESRG